VASDERQIPLVEMQSVQNGIRRTTGDRHRILRVGDSVCSARVYKVLAVLCFVAFLVSPVAWQGVPPAWAQTQIHDATSVELIGVGGTFPLPIYTKWFEEYRALHRGVRFRYLPAGSAEGIHQASNGMSDFGGSDVPLTDEELAKAPTKLLLLPSVLGGVVPIYNLPGITRELRFTPDVLAGIYLGTIRNWNDTAIAEINPGSSMPHRRIEVIYRGDPSGTTYIWTEFLSKVSGEWKKRVGRGVDVKWPVGKPSAKGSGSLARLVKETPNSIGYLELTFALQNNLPFGSIRNLAGKFIKADLKSLSAAAASKTASIRSNDFRVSLTNASGESSYPIASFTWLLIPKNSVVPASGAALKDFLQWMLTDGQGFAVDLGYASLPNELVREELAAVEKL
jgi:phosphate transport system substrate-binding protein